jgi:hypothetical protein
MCAKPQKRRNTHSAHGCRLHVIECLLPGTHVECAGHVATIHTRHYPQTLRSTHSAHSWWSHPTPHCSTRPTPHHTLCCSPCQLACQVQEGLLVVTYNEHAPDNNNKRCGVGWVVNTTVCRMRMVKWLWSGGHGILIQIPCPPTLQRLRSTHSAHSCRLPHPRLHHTPHSALPAHPVSLRARYRKGFS